METKSSLHLPTRLPHLLTHSILGGVDGSDTHPTAVPSSQAADLACRVPSKKGRGELRAETSRAFS